MEQALCAVIVNAVEVHGSDLPRWAQLQPIAVYKYVLFFDFRRARPLR